MMSVTSTSRDNKDSQGTQQAGEETKGSKLIKHMPSSSTRPLVFKNPRIVRVSRNWGGKDRHSKVCTVKGLRDRRIRLSVPTAVQLYDLQDRLGLPQPSKVIDWLIDATKDDIDRLPPLQFPPGFSSSQFFHHQQMFLSQSLQEYSRSTSSSRYPLFLDPNPTFGEVHSLGVGINSRDREHGEAESSNLRARNDKEATTFIDKGKWIMGKSPNEENQEGIGNLASFINAPMPFNPYIHSNSSNLSFSSPQFGSHGSYNLIQLENSLNSNGSSMSLMPPSSSLALSSTSQLFFSASPPATTILPQFFPPPYHPFFSNSSTVESGSRNIDGFQFLTPSAQQVSTSLKPSPLNANSGFVLRQDNNGSSLREREHNAHS